MRIQLLSDLHLSVHPMEAAHSDADVVVLAGDLHRPEAAMAWARQFRQPTLYVAGNHEFYGSDLVTTLAQMRQHARSSQVHVLERDEWHYQGVRFLGCTLWSDYRLFADDALRDEGVRQATELVRDFSRIRVAPHFEQRFTPAVSQLLFDMAAAWLDERFADDPDMPTVVITHYAPARGSIAARFAGSPLNLCFVSDLELQIRRWQPRLWLHGHVHDSFDYRIGATRVVTNPRGYAPGGQLENPAFDPLRIIEID